MYFFLLPAVTGRMMFAFLVSFFLPPLSAAAAAAAVVVARMCGPHLCKCKTTQRSRRVKPAFMVRHAVAAQMALLGGRVGTHQCRRSGLTEELVNRSTVAKRRAH